MPEVNWGLALTIGFGILFGNLLTRIVDWIIGGVRGQKAG